MDNYYLKTIEKEFEKKIEWEVSRNKRNTMDGKHAVFQYMLEDNNKIWFWAWEFVGKMTQGGKEHSGQWLSHRAPARASDLALHHSDIVEHRKIGRFCVYRVRRENQKEINEFLSEGLIV